MTIKKNVILLQLLLAIILNLLCFSLIAQKGDRDFEDRWEKKKNRNSSHWHGDWDWNNNWGDVRLGLLDIGFSTYLHDGNLNLPRELDDFDLLYGGSININWHVIRHRVRLIKSDLRFEYGLTLSWMQYKFSNDFRILEDTSPLTLQDDGIDYKKNKLKTTFLEIPFMLTIAPGKRKSFYLSGGYFVGFLIGSKQKLKTQDGDKTKIKDDFNLNKFRYGVAGRIGLGPIAFYAEIALNDLFKEDQGPQLTPFNIGITVLNF